MNFSRLTNAHIEWQDDLPFSAEFGDIYFSRENAIAETRHVFLDGNRLPERFSAVEKHFVIGECGFGSGLNFLCAWELFRHTAKPGTRLYFISTEQHPLTPEDLQRFHRLWPELQQFSRQLQAQYPHQGQGLHRLQFYDGNYQINLDLLLGDAGEQFASLLPTHRHHVDAWFLDGFAPRSNPSMWSADLFTTLSGLSHGQSTLATYSVSASVREALDIAGFKYEKYPGYGKKRHMLRAFRSTEPGLEVESAKPATARQRKNTCEKVSVIGGGIAGCTVARALAEKGVSVTLLEQAGSVAEGASGNPRGVMFLPLHRAPSAKASYLRHSFHFARRHYNRLFEQYTDIDWQACGALQLTRKNSEDYFERVAANPVYDDTLVRLINQAEATAVSGIHIDQDALYLPLSGTINPSELCRALIRHPNIEVSYSKEISSISYECDTWNLKDKSGKTITSAPTLIVANGLAAKSLLPQQDYPLFPNRGQLTLLEKNEESGQLNVVLCGKGYLSPATQGFHVCGGSFNPGDSSTEYRKEDDKRNLELLQDLCPGIADNFSMDSVLSSRSALRCTTRDYFPLAGPVETHDAPLADKINNMTSLPGLYLFSGLGSHGITTALLAAEYLASLIREEPLPLTQQAREMLAPARFRWRREKK